MKNEKLDIKKLISIAPPGPTRWELDNIVWHDRTSNPITLLKFLKRIEQLRDISEKTLVEASELELLEDLSTELDQAECEELLSDSEEAAHHHFIESIARKGALETLCNDALSIETMTDMCKLSPDDFILAAKRSQDIINSVQELVIQGETLSKDVAGA